MASEGVATRTWSSPSRFPVCGPRGCPPGLTPGTTSRKSFPHARRMVRTSSGEATTPSRPACFVRRASWTTRLDMLPEIPTLRRAAASMLVKIVTPSSLGRVCLVVAQLSRASTAARIISSPPRAWTSSNAMPGNPAAATTAPRIVLGMSWYFKSRKRRGPSCASRVTAVGPSPVNKCIFILYMPTRWARRSARGRAVSSVGKSSARMSLRRARSIRDVSAPQAAQFATGRRLRHGCRGGRPPDRRHRCLDPRQMGLGH